MFFMEQTLNKPEANTIQEHDQERMIEDLKQKALNSFDESDRAVTFYNRIEVDASTFWKGLYQGFVRAVKG